MKNGWLSAGPEVGTGCEVMTAALMVCGEATNRGAAQ